MRPGREPRSRPRSTTAVTRMAVWTQGRHRCTRGSARRAGSCGRAAGSARRSVGQHLAPSAVLSLHRAQLVGWLAQASVRGSTGRRASPGSPRRATAPPSRRRGWARSRPSATATTSRRPGCASRTARGAGQLVAWTGYENGRFVVRQAQVKGAANNPSQSLVGVATLSQPGVDTVLSDLVVDPSGPSYVLMLAGARGSDSSSPTGLTVRAGGGEEVSAPVGPDAQPGGVVGNAAVRRARPRGVGDGQRGRRLVRAGPRPPASVAALHDQGDAHARQARRDGRARDRREQRDRGGDGAGPGGRGRGGRGRRTPRRAPAQPRGRDRSRRRARRTRSRPT